MHKTIIRILLFVFIGASSLQSNILQLHHSGKAVNDFAGILSADKRSYLNAVSTTVFQKSNVAIVFVSVPAIEENDIDEIANRLYEKWGIGKKDTDEGVLIFLALKERKIRIETGYGVEGYITDMHCASIIRNASSNYLKYNRWDDGINCIFHALITLVADEKNIPLQHLTATSSYAHDSQPYRSRKRSTANPLLFFIIVIFLIATPFGRSLLPWLFLFSMNSRRSYHGGFGGNFTHRSGGFGGFGGGFSGGGGASGDF